MPTTAPVAAGSWTSVNAFPHLSFQDPTCLVFTPGTNRVLVGGREGLIWTFVNDPAVTTKSVFLDLSAHTQGWNDSGLLGIVLHPQFGQAGSPNRGYIYVYYSYTPGPILGSASEPPNNRTTPSFSRLSRFTVPDGANAADPSSEVVLINQFRRDLWHNGGALMFGADGFLYLTIGDEGGSDDEYHSAQTLNGGLFAGIFRIDVDQDPVKSHPIRRQPLSNIAPPAGWPASYSGHYSIPNDNPWQDPSGGTLEEYWALGVRSPHRMTLDAVTGQIWLGDVGQDAWEEIDLVSKGANYQWPYREGNHPGFQPMPSPLIGVDTPPVYDYSHATGSSCVIGGFVYRGSQFAAQLGGSFIYGDNTSNQVWSLVPNGSAAPTLTPLASLPPGSDYTGGLSSFGQDLNHELYLTTMGPTGSIYQLQLAGQSSAAIPALLSQTGAFANLATLTPAAGLVPYTVNQPLWSDGAVKSRWIALPTGTKIGFSVQGEWSFPPGTVFIKHFELGTDDTNPAVRRRLETRLIVRAKDGTVYGATYKWRADNSDADLLAGSLSEPVTIATATGTRIQTWYYPSRQDCLTCHNANANFILGVKTRQLNGNFTYPSTGLTDNQLRTFNHLGLLSPAIAESSIPTYAHLVSVSDTTASLETRVRSYLDANCAQCHRPSGVQTYWDARFDTPLASQGIINGPLVNNLGVANAKVLAPGDIARSMMSLRTNATGVQGQMPPLARNLTDPQAVSTLAAYIASLPMAPVPFAGPNQGVAPNTVVNLTGSVTNLPAGTPATYAWSQVIGPAIPITNANSLNASVTPPSAGTFAFALTVSASGSSSTSDPVYITVGPPAAPITSSLPSNLTLAAGQTSTLIVAPIGIPAPTVQWFKNGQPLPGATQYILILSNVQLSDSGNYTATVTNSLGSDTTNVEVVAVNAPVTIAAQPQAPTGNVPLGSPFTFSVGAVGTAPIAYQWWKDGAPLVGANAASLTLPAVSASDRGTYSVVVSNASGSVNSAAVTLPPPGVPGRLVNISGLSFTGAGSQTLIAGFSVHGSGTKPFLMRGIGPALAPFGVSNFLPDPTVQLFDEAAHVLATDNDWEDNGAGPAIAATAAGVGAFALPAGSKDASLLATVGPGNYTAQVTGPGGAAGGALAEIYDGGPSSGTLSIVNFSIRGQAGIGTGILTAGFVIGGDLPATVLIRGVGSSLAQFGLTGLLADPRLQVFDGGSHVIAQNDNWGDTANNPALVASTAQTVGAFPLPAGSTDAAVVIQLVPGKYTIQVSGANATTGVAIVEIYLVP